MILDLDDKRALVTAGSYGLGYACAKSLSRELAQVMICSREPQNVARAVDLLSNETDNPVHGVAADISTAEGIEKVIESAKTSLGDIDIITGTSIAIDGGVPQTILRGRYR